MSLKKNAENSQGRRRREVGRGSSFQTRSEKLGSPTVDNGVPPVTSEGDILPPNPVTSPLRRSSFVENMTGKHRPYC